MGMHASVATDSVCPPPGEFVGPVRRAGEAVVRG